MILVDTGPLVAIHDKEDPYHRGCVNELRAISDQQLVTTWACFTEAIYLLGRGGGFHFQSRLWQSCKAALLELLDLSPAEIDRAEELMASYCDLPMDLADATLVAAAEFRHCRKVFTLDAHFFACRFPDGNTLEIIMPQKD